MTRRGFRARPKRAVERRFQPPPRQFQPAPRPLSAQEFVEAAEQFSQVTPAQIHAVRKTGKIITGANRHQFSQADQDAFAAAVKEYRMPPEKVLEVFHQHHKNLQGADPTDIMSSALSYAVSISLHIGWSTEEFVAMFKDVYAETKVRHQHA